MILDIDAGNSRVKWLVKDDGGHTVSRGVTSSDLWSRQDMPGDPAVSRVRISSVKGDLDDRLTEYCEGTLGVHPEFARVVDGCAGLSCGYGKPGNLGIDRWLALLSCWQTISREALVVDAGSAMTIDVLSGDRHCGGYIMPGFAMMKTALGAGTWGIAIDDNDKIEAGPATGTTGAVLNGSMIALVAAVERIAGMAGVETIVLTGGDGPLIKQFLASRFSVIEEPDLVINGLAIALP